MHHEVLLAAVGCPGDIIRPTGHGGASSSSLYAVAPGVSFLSPAERAATDRVVCLGGHYAALRAFVDRHRYCVGGGGASLLVGKSSGGQGEKGSLYLQALSAGMDELLAEYEATIARLEQECLADPHLPTSRLHVLLAKEGGWPLTLPWLAALAADIERRGLRGGRVLELLHHESLSGSPRVKAVVGRLMQRVQAVFLHQTKRWCLEGDLSADSCGEFFVVAKGADGELQEQQQLPSNDDDDDDGSDQTAAAEYEWGSRFRLQWDRVPLLADFFPAALAERAFFLGRAVRILRRSSSSSSPSPHPPLNAQQWTSMLAEAAKAKQPVPAWEVERVLQATYKAVAERLLRVVVGEQGLLEELQIIRDLFLLGAGAAFYPFIAHPQHRPQLANPTHGAALDLAAGFASIVLANYSTGGERGQGGGSSSSTMARYNTVGGWEGGQQGDVRSRMSLTLVSPKEEAGLRPRLAFRTRCPLVLTNEALDTYNAVFARLLQAKRLSFELERLWPLLIRKAQEVEDTLSGASGGGKQRYGRQRRQQQKQEGPAVLPPVWVGQSTPVDRDAMFKVLYALRARAAYVASGLMYHWQAEVIDTGFHELRAAVQEAGDFEGVVTVHKAFYLRLAARCFVGQGEALRPVKQALTYLLASTAHLTSLAESVLARNAKDFTEAFVRSVRREAGDIHVAITRQTAFFRDLLDGLPEGREFSVRLLATAVCGDGEQDRWRFVHCT